MEGNCMGNLYVIMMLFVFFLTLYIYAAPYYQTVAIVQVVDNEERFEEAGHQLLPPDKIAVIQGNAVPEKNPKRVIFDQCDPAAQSVDGSKDGPRSLFTFAYNKCDPSCCDGSPYSCNGGCVCLTENQKKFFARQRGL